MYADFFKKPIQYKFLGEELVLDIYKDSSKGCG